MSKINKKFISVVLMFGLMGFSSLTFAEERTLTGDEITAMFSDKTVSGHHAFKEKKTINYFSADGTFKRIRLDNDESAEGKWWVDGKNRLCKEKKGDKKTCRGIVDDNGTIKKFKKKKHVWTYTKFEDGNKL